MASLAERRFDVLLASVASSFGPRALAVVLSGSGRDGAEGVAAMKRAGAIVIAQSPETAHYPSMPIAAAKAGADLVLPVHDIGGVLARIVEGAPLPSVSDAGETANSFGTPPPKTGRKMTPAGGEPTETGEMTDAQHNGRTQLSVDRAIGSAAIRAEAARLRAAELRRRRQDLAAGFGATAETVAIAQRRAEESIRRAQQARQAAMHAAAHRHK
ncbi:hypothetical protein MSTO_22900 [Mycobacterium stomatepiae]|uniref:protein-glutamate methylesterase n=2 Tax=Mycobacterium stomatepiae TaxID=470076 RepID=A0A7I7Q6V4_9MYCO|nr:hypothetical protein MSTO_22900 [Mycobacterium stomatepiae]